MVLALFVLAALALFLGLYSFVFYAPSLALLPARPVAGAMWRTVGGHASPCASAPIARSRWCR